MLALAAALLTGAAIRRSFEYDEAYSIFLTAGDPRPAWPAGVFTAGSVRGVYAGQASLASVARNLRRTDVHPPLYFWALAIWRRYAGETLFAARMLSVLLALGALAVVALIARQSGIPAAPAMLFTLGCYGFAYTGAVARGFALAQVLTLGGVLLGLVAARRPCGGLAAGAGLLLGAASFVNYLAAFVGASTLLWLALVRLRIPRIWVAAWIGFAVWLPGDLWFFLAQRNSRTGQFPPFHWLAGLERLGRDAAGAVFGGLPLYVHGPAQFLVGAALVLLLACLVALICRQWTAIGRPEPRLLLGMAAVAPPLGLLLLGLVFDNTPIELRYMAFATPFIGLLIAGMLASLPRAAGLALGAVVLGVQAVALAGLLTRPETMQPARATAAAAASLAGQDGVVLLPRGNDGVGVVGPFLAEAPGWLRVQVVDDAAAGRIGELMVSRVVLVLAAPDAHSRAEVPALRAAFTAPCWRPVGIGVNVAEFERTCGGR